MLPIETSPGNRIRKRKYSFLLPQGNSGLISSNGTISRTYWNANVLMEQRTVDDRVTGWPTYNKLLHSKNVTGVQKRALRRLDVGGEFLSERQSYVHQPAYYSKMDKRLVGTYFANGLPLCGVPVASITPSSIWWPSLDPDDLFDLWGKGSTAIKNVAPLVPAVSLSQSLGELREGLPKLARKLGSIQEVANTSGSNFLGWQFGVKPLIADFNNIKNAAENYDRALEKLEESSDNLLHRAYTFEEEVTTTTESSGLVPSWPAPPSPVAAPSGVRTVKLIERTQDKFTGAFSFHFIRARAGLQELKTWASYYGINPTADTLWNLTPYSWLADWFGNFGDVLFNASYLSQNNQIMNYGYLQRTSDACRQITFENAFGTSIQEFHMIRKLRIRASPFGFGISDEDLTDSQTAILAALGITRFT